MGFSGFPFLFACLPVVLFCYYVIPARFREARNMILLAVSLFFYSYGGPVFLLLLAASISINYCCGLAAGSAHLRSAAVACAVVLNLGLLGWFKYAAFVLGGVAMLFPALPVPQVTLPLGISFFTFKGISYVIDVGRGDVAAQKNPLRVALYLAFFPQLLAGPIARFSTMEHAISNRRETLEDFAEGGVRFCFGLAKKMLLADPLGQMADSAFALSPAALSPGMAWLGILAYAGQIYLDFSAYSDMAIGLGRMFGFHTPENFNYPYVAQSISDFWRRWHISLSTWFRDYLYIPLGGNRCSVPRHIFNLLVVWMATGLWHGAAWNFILWGLYYGVLLTGERYLWGSRLEKAPAALRHAITVFFVLVGWVLFRAEHFSQIAAYLAALFGKAATQAAGGQIIYSLLQYRWEFLIGLFAVLPLKPWLERMLARRQDKPMARIALVCVPSALALLLLFCAVVRLSGTTFQSFIYFRF